MGVFDRLGITVGAIQNMMPFRERRDAYAADITYGTNSEFGFDYLRDNMAVSLEGVVQRGHAFRDRGRGRLDPDRRGADAADHLRRAGDRRKTYYDFARVVRELEGQPATRKTAKGLDETELSGADYLYDEKHKTVSPAQIAIEKVERALRIDNLYDPRNVQLVNHLTQALKAESLYKRDVDYVVQDGEVKIVDEFTGRIMEGRRWSEGLHQAIEAKEGVRIREENVTLATITLQNYFRLYEKLGGMTGTAKTEEKEFVEIYGLNVVEIPTNVSVQRADQNDYIFKTQAARFDAVVDDIVQRHEAGQPVLVGTIAVETSEHLSELLTRRGIDHNVLNAKEHEREADIIAQAGRKHAVTIATNMAGRGVDIVLGGNPQHELRKQLHAEGFEEGVQLDDELRTRFEEMRPEWQRDHEEIKELGGLYVLATERHEARRIDNQLRGRSGRQGDPGESRFYLSAQDDLVRLFAGDRIHSIMERFKLPEDQPMESGLLSKQIENAQKKVEEQNFVARKNVLKYDDVMNVQRQVIYEQRRRVLEGEDLSDDIRQWIEEVISFNVANFTDAEVPEEWDLAGLVGQMQGLYGSDITVEEVREEVELTRDALTEEFTEDALESYEEREQSFGSDPGTGLPILREIERYVILQGRRHALARAPREHGLPARGRAPARDGAEGSARRVPRRRPRDVRGARPPDPRGGRAHALPRRARAGRRRPAAARPAGRRADALRARDGAGADVIAAAGGAVAGAAAATALADPPRQQQVVNEHRDIGRNDPCWCGSGKKYKKCHGA